MLTFCTRFDWSKYAVEEFDGQAALKGFVSRGITHPFFGTRAFIVSLELIRVPDVVLPSSFLISLVDTFYLWP